MGVLTEYVRKEAEQIRAGIHTRQQQLDEWIVALGHLYDTLELWIRAADSGLGLLATTRESRGCTVRESRLGQYSAPVLSAFLGNTQSNRAAIILPQARYVAAIIQPPGREPKRADGIVRIEQYAVPEYFLFRSKTEAGDEWFIRSATEWETNRLDNTVEPLDRDHFEAALLRVLQ